MGFLSVQWTGVLSDQFLLGLSSNWIIPFDPDQGYDFVGPQFLLGTYKTNRSTFHGGIGVAISEEDLSILGQFGVVSRLSEKFSIVSENYWGYDPTNNTYEDNFFVIGILGRMHFSKWHLDLGIANGIIIGGDGNGIQPLPHLAFTVDLSK